MYRAPQRNYSPKALETWFERLTQDWETWFSEDELKWGRRYYRENQARSTELLEDSAIVHFGTRKEEVYIIVDWDAEQPTFRISNPDLAPGAGLGIAGLYELEEFLADEIPPVIEVSEDKESMNGNRASPSVSPVTQGGKKERVQAEKFIRVYFEGTSKGIRMETVWETRDGKALDKVKIRDLNSAERESFIRLTTLAHRFGFGHQETQRYSYLSDPLGIQTFLNRGLELWRRQLRVKLDPGLESWKRGLREVEPVLKIESSSEDKAEFAWGFRLGGKWLDAGLSEGIFRHHQQNHFIPGLGMVRLTESAKEIIHDWKSAGHGHAKGELPKYLLFSFMAERSIGVELGSAIESWRRSVEQKPTKALKGMDRLRPYQKEGVQWMNKLLESGCHALLADEMGLGKTFQTLTLLEERKQLNGHLNLIVCPSSVVPVWEAEIRDKFPLASFEILSRKNPFSTKKKAIWISSYSQVRRHRSDLVNVEFENVILDEAQTIKNPDAKTTQACFALRSRHRIVLTGTPVENRPMDLWTLFRFLMPGFLGSRRRFSDLFKSDPERAEDRLRLQIAPFILRRTKKNVLKELPPKLLVNWRCPLSSAQKKLYRNLVTQGREELGSGDSRELSQKAIPFFALLTRLRQASCDPYLVSQKEADWRQSGKLVSMVSRLDEAIANGSKVVIFSQFVQFLKRIRLAIKSEFPELPIYELTGQTVDRNKPVSGFQAEADPAVFLISLKAGGTGLNLQTADYVFLMDPWWNPAVEAQAIDRVHRFGQENQVTVYRFLTHGTIEERIEELKGSKQALFDSLLGDLDEPKNLFEHFNNIDELLGDVAEWNDDDDDQ